jgi:hypothetical protein
MLLSSYEDPNRCGGDDEPKSLNLLNPHFLYIRERGFPKKPLDIKLEGSSLFEFKRDLR